MEVLTMNIGIFHGYDLSGSGSNEYTRYLARSIFREGHNVHLICREYKPENIDFLTHVYSYDEDGAVKELSSISGDGPSCYLHQLPLGDVCPVYITDKQREGNVKSFINLTDEELASYRDLNRKCLELILGTHPLDVLHCNHLVYQPVIANGPCQTTNTPFIIYPHGSSIEYTVKMDNRYFEQALGAVRNCTGLIIGNCEVRDRILSLYPEYKEDILDKTRIVGVGVDTALFSPIEGDKKRDSINSLLELNLGGGKEPSQVEELCHRLRSGDVSVVQEYWTAYKHSKPDADINEKLQRIPWDGNILLYVGAFTAGKGIQSLIAGLPGVLRKTPDTHLVIVGSGIYREVLEAMIYAIKSGNKDLLSMLCEKGFDLDRSDITGPWKDVKQYIKNDENIAELFSYGANLDQHIHFVGRLVHSELQYLFPCADLAVFPSVVPEAYPLVLMESLSNGVFPVVSYFSGFKDGVDELSSYIEEDMLDKMKIPMEPDIRIHTLKENIKHLLGNSKLKTIKNNLSRIAVENFDWKLRARQMVKAYHDLINT